MEHTPGPHRIDKEILNYQSYINPEFSDRYAGCIKSEDNMVLAVVIDDDTPGEANLKLYAAAPTMRDFIQDVADNKVKNGYELMMNARILLEQTTKATGGE